MLYAHCESGSTIVTVKAEVLPEIKVLVQVNAHTPGQISLREESARLLLHGAFVCAILTM